MSFPIKSGDFYGYVTLPEGIGYQAKGDRRWKHRWTECGAQLAKFVDIYNTVGFMVVTLMTLPSGKIT